MKKLWILSLLGLLVVSVWGTLKLLRLSPPTVKVDTNEQVDTNVSSSTSGFSNGPIPENVTKLILKRTHFDHGVVIPGKVGIEQVFPVEAKSPESRHEIGFKLEFAKTSTLTISERVLTGKNSVQRTMPSEHIGFWNLQSSPPVIHWHISSDVRGLEYVFAVDMPLPKVKPGLRLDTLEKVLSAYPNAKCIWWEAHYE